MILKDAECFELVIREVRDAKLIANALLIEGYDVQITPIMSAISSTNTGLSRKYIVTVRQGLNIVVTTT